MSGANWGNGGGFDPNQGYGLLSGYGTNPSSGPLSLVGNGLLSPDQQHAIAMQGLMAMAGGYGQMAMPSRMPVPLGAVLGAGAAQYGPAANQATELALKGGLLGLQGQELKAKLGMYQQAMQPPPPMYAPGQGTPGVGGGLLSPNGSGAGAGGLPPGNGLIGAGGASGTNASGGGVGVPLPVTMHAIGDIESSNNPNAKDGAAGEVGQFQIMPSTAAQYGVSASMMRDPTIYNKLANQMFNDYSARYNGDPQAIAVAWNAGPNAADNWIKNGRNNSVLPAETQNYLGKLNTRLGPQGGAGGQGVGSGVPTSPAPYSPPPPPRVVSPDTGATGINPGYIQWAQQQSRVMTALGMKVPGYIDQAATIPIAGATESQRKAIDSSYDAAIAAYKKQLEIAGAEPIAAGQEAGRYPYVVAENWNKPMVARPGAAVINPATGQPIYGAPIATPNVNPATGNTTQGWSYPPGSPNVPTTAPTPGYAGAPGPNVSQPTPGTDRYGVPPSLQRQPGQPTSAMMPSAGPAAAPSAAPITKLGPMREEQLEGVGKTDAENRQANIEAAQNAQLQQVTLNRMKVDAPNMPTGWGADYRHEAESFLRTMFPGFNGSVASYEDFVKNAGQLTRQAVKETSSRAAVQEFKLIENALPNPEMSPQGLNGVLGEYQGLNDWRIFKANAQANWEKSNGVGNVTGFEDYWRQNVSPDAFVVNRMAPDAKREMFAAVHAKGKAGDAELQSLAKQIQFIKANGLDAQ